MRKVLVLKRTVEGRNFLEHRLVQWKVGAQVNWPKLSQQGVVVKSSDRHYWVALKGINLVVKLRAA